MLDHRLKNQMNNLSQRKLMKIRKGHIAPTWKATGSSDKV